uniref:Sprouty-related, EVH1 domain-containing protein 1 n=1 Tax=Cacopsylla melanoneura TaxID=428564 RepID=A0A8D8PNR7_9HEMI
MSSISEDGGNNLVRVRAQVMTRDDSAGGWVAMGGGGLSNVSVKKIEVLPPADGSPHTGPSKFEYVIFGKRISDQSVVLSCTITRDFTYNKVMPTFHHWQTSDKKFGLTFQAAADARAFDQGVRNALQEYLHAHPLCELWEDKDRAYGFSGSVDLMEEDTDEDEEEEDEDDAEHERNGESADGDEDNVFDPVELPSKNSSSHSSSQDYASRTSPPSSNSSIPSKALPPLVLDSKDLLTMGGAPPPLPPTSVPGGGGYTTVAIVGGHGGDELKKPPHPVLGRGRRLCKFCSESFSEENNPPGSCRFGPDPRGGWLESLQCMPCAQYVQDKCDNAPPHTRPPLWLSLSFFCRYLVPLLCCCGLLSACHEPCVQCGLMGARHQASDL